MTFPNPQLNGFHPDPSVVKAGDEYYLATSSFEYLPGIPVHRSHDFVDWELVGHVATSPERLGVSDVATGGGAWAPTIRFHDGVFHLVVTVAMGRGMLHFTASDPAGPWSDGDVVLDVSGSGSVNGIDPDIAWDDDGACYITYSGLVLSGDGIGEHLGIQQVRVDLERHVALEEPRSLWSGSGFMFPEAPHLYRHGEHWYLMIAEGGTERGHSISIARGPSPEGPFAPAPANPLVSARSTARPVQNTGHGDLVEGPDGGWLCVLLGVRPRSATRAFSALGRETFVTPARWRADGWLEIDPVELAPRAGDRVEIDFADDLDGEWIAVRRAPADVAARAAGGLVVRGDGQTLDDPRPAFLGRRQEHLANSVTVDLAPVAGVGGLAVRYDEEFHVELEVGGGLVTARAVVPTLRQEWTLPYDGGAVSLRISSRQGAGGGFGTPRDELVLAASVGGAEFAELARVDGRFLSSETAESFTGRVIGLYAVDGEVTATRWVAEGDDD
ncbi:family 43 glycosylhydrolase [Microbacterium betulae]|uniref:Family 43 glycosylhydrolase n=1 Tax=Microbacterium betulae TaxID=2981139 RepID=A0AA97I7H8_9MICO|nr:family 43 glycosylhydrolase [Microbacterium sp. AB]WOF24282.1 family 43 glycosylhydrolase [Microbacterium sp. AB]